MKFGTWFAPAWLLNNIIDECCPPSSTSVFSIDTTYGIGPFYVTPTSYTRKDVLYYHRGNSAVFPGPLLIHQTKTKGNFFFFASTLKEVDYRITDLRFIGGDRDAAQQHFVKAFPHHRFLPCTNTKHIQDDIVREMKDMDISKKKREQIVEEIFGSVQKEIRGLIDSESELAFDQHLEALSKSWDGSFVTYFNDHIRSDVKNGTLNSVCQFTLNFVLAVYVTRIGDRFNDAKCGKAGRMKFFNLWFAFFNCDHFEARTIELHEKHGFDTQ